MEMLWCYHCSLFLLKFINFKVYEIAQKQASPFYLINKKQQFSVFQNLEIVVMMLKRCFLISFQLFSNFKVDCNWWTIATITSTLSRPTLTVSLHNWIKNLFSALWKISESIFYRLQHTKCGSRKINLELTFSRWGIAGRGSTIPSTCKLMKNSWRIGGGELVIIKINFHLLQQNTHL